MSLYRENPDIYKYNPTNPLGIRKTNIRPCESDKLDATVPYRFSRRNIILNGNYPGRYIIGDYDRVCMVPPDMVPEEKCVNWP